MLVASTPNSTPVSRSSPHSIAHSASRQSLTPACTSVSPGPSVDISPVNQRRSFMPVSPAPSADISSANHSRSFVPISPSPSIDTSPVNHSPSFTPSPINHSRTRDFTPPPAAHPIRQASAPRQELTSTAQLSAPKRSAPQGDDAVDWKHEYDKLHRKYCILKEKVKMMEQQTTQEG